MTDNEIIEALERCIASDGKRDCDSCPFNDELLLEDCTAKLLNEATSLIVSQKEEIERLENGLAISKKEIKRYITSYKAVKVEAVKEFIEMLKEELRNIAKIDFQGGYYYLIGEALFYNLLMEMERKNND